MNSYRFWPQQTPSNTTFHSSFIVLFAAGAGLFSWLVAVPQIRRGNWPAAERVKSSWSGMGRRQRSLRLITHPFLYLFASSNSKKWIGFSPSAHSALFSLFDGASAGQQKRERAGGAYRGSASLGAPFTNTSLLHWLIHSSQSSCLPLLNPIQGRVVFVHSFCFIGWVWCWVRFSCCGALALQRP